MKFWQCRYLRTRAFLANFTLGLIFAWAARVVFARANHTDQTRENQKDTYGSRMDQIYSAEDLAKIGDAVGIKPAEIVKYRSRFDGAMFWFRAMRGTDADLAELIQPAKVRKKLEQISNTARRLLHHLGIENTDDAIDGPADHEIHHHLQISGDQTAVEVVDLTERLGTLTAVIEGIEAALELQRRANKAASDMDHVGAILGPGEHKGDVAVSQWIAIMLDLYRDITGKAPATSVGARGESNEGIATGPLIRFLEAAGGPPGLSFNEDAWRSRVRTVMKYPGNQN